MKRFKFRLEQVLRIRRIQEDQARAHLAAANRAAREAAEHLAARNTRYETAERPHGVQSEDEFALLLFRLDAAAGAVRAARVARLRATEEVDSRRDDWSAANRRVSALERLEERDLEAHAIELRRAEDRMVDDLVVARHRRRGDSE